MDIRPFVPSLAYRMCLAADGAFPAIVVCPASLKLNWMRELDRWLPGRSARMLTGVSARAELDRLK